MSPFFLGLTSIFPNFLEYFPNFFKFFFYFSKLFLKNFPNLFRIFPKKNFVFFQTFFFVFFQFFWKTSPSQYFSDFFLFFLILPKKSWDPGSRDPAFFRLCGCILNFLCIFGGHPKNFAADFWYSE